MENTPNKESSALFQGILIAVVVIALFFSGNLLGKLGADPAADKEEDTQVEDVVASTSESTTVPTTAPTTQPTTQATPDVSEDANQTTAPSNDTASSGEMSKAEIIALFNESANKVKTEATKVVKNYEYKRMLEEHLDVPSALNGMMDTLMGSVMKDDLEPQEYTGEMIIEKYPVPRETWSSKLTEADVVEATCVDNGTEYVYIVGDGSNWSDVRTFTTDIKGKNTSFFIFESSS